MKIEGVNIDTDLKLSWDRPWEVTDPQGRKGIVTDYNWEVTSIPEFLSGVFGYSDSWWYWKDEFRRRGWTVEEMERPGA